MSATLDADEDLRRTVLEGLLDSPKRLPAAYFYDAAGSALFEQICELPEYYLTRAEAQILQQQGADIARHVGAGALLVEPGCGSGEKACLLLRHLRQPAGFVPVEISASALAAAEHRVRRQFPGLAVHALRDDFSASFTIPDAASGRPVLFFPGSTLGNFDPQQASALLRRWRAMAEVAVLGVDLQKDAARLVAAYDDARGVTAAFNRNMLVRINREMAGDFDPAAFDHVALWNASEGRMEMHLRSRGAQSVRVCGRRIDFEAGESIHTENSYKYSDQRMAALAETAGWRVRASWTDAQRLFGVYLLGA